MNKFTKYRLAGELEATVSSKLLYLFLLDTVDGAGKICIPQREIYRSLGLSRTAVSRNLRRLEETGTIKIEATWNELGGQMANKYYVLED